MKDLADRLIIEVPKQIEILKENGGPNAEDQERPVQAWQSTLKDLGPLMFEADSAKSEEQFKELAFCLAVESFRRGGVKLFGLQWETK